MALIAECDRERVATLAVTITPRAWTRNRELAADAHHVRVALGLHPQLVAEREAEVALFERHLSEARYAGEVGLDAGPRFYASFAAQERVFERILRLCAEQGGKILTVHSVRAVAKVLGHIERTLPSDATQVVLHKFTGTPAEARRRPRARASAPGVPMTSGRTRRSSRTWCPSSIGPVSSFATALAEIRTFSTKPVSRIPSDGR